MTHLISLTYTWFSFGLRCYGLHCFAMAGLQCGALICSHWIVVCDAHELANLYIGLLWFALPCVAVVCFALQCCDLLFALFFRSTRAPQPTSEAGCAQAMQRCIHQMMEAGCTQAMQLCSRYAVASVRFVRAEEDGRSRSHAQPSAVA